MRSAEFGVTEAGEFEMSGSSADKDIPESVREAAVVGLIGFVLSIVLFGVFLLAAFLIVCLAVKIGMMTVG